MERALKSKEGERFANVWDLAEYYTQTFLEDWRRLNLSEPTVRPKATQHVREQILMTEALVARGNAYETPTGVYFDVESKPDYGKLSGNTQDKLQEAVRDVVLDENKRRQADFALWKKDDKHLMQWHSPWGWGFPGWHIECSAMARAYLGDTIDLHSGGEDNAFPHHECEIAQSEAYTGHPFANHWMHVRFLQVEGEKMAKSAGNFYTVRDLVGEGFDPIALRYALISVPYGKPMNFTLQLLRDAQGNTERFREARRRAAAADEGAGGGGDLAIELERLYEEALDALCNDLNTSVAIAKALEGAKAVLREPVLGPEHGAAALLFLDRIEALMGVCPTAASDDAPCEVATVDGRPVEAWIADRATAKGAKDFAKADAIRARLAEEGIELRDSPDGTSWSRKPRI
jgi:cysteinyl-tRNA synthetase